MRRAAGEALAALALALAVRLALRALTGFDGLYGQDAYAYFDYSAALRTALASGLPPPPFHYPLGYPFLTALAMAVLGARPLAAQLVSLLAGAAVAPLTALLLRELRPQASRAALAGAALAALAPQLVLVSLTAMSDTTALALATLSAWALARFARLRHTRWLALAALALGAAVATRWAMTVLAVPWAATALVVWRRDGTPIPRVLAAGAIAATVGAVVPAAVLAPSLLHGRTTSVGEFSVVTWSPANALRSTLHNADGTLEYAVPVGVYVLEPLLHPAFVFPTLAPLLLFGLLAVRRDPAATVLLVGWPLAVVTLLAGLPWENPRFPLAYLPPLAVLVGLGADALLSARIRPLQRRLAAVACLVGLAGAAAWSVRLATRFTAAAESQRATVRWAARLAPRDAVLVTFGLTATARHLSDVEVGELWEQTPATLKAALCAGRPMVLLLDENSIIAQWRGRSPATNLAWLRSQGLDVLGRNAPFTLWRVRPSACR